MNIPFEKLDDGLLYINKWAVLEAGLTSDSYLQNVNNKKKRGWEAITDPRNGKNIVVPYEALNDERKAQIKGKFGDPYDFIARLPILKMVKMDLEAHNFFLTYEYEFGDRLVKLSPKQVAQSTRAHAWLTSLQQVTKTKQWKEVQAQLGLKYKPDFYKHAAALIKPEINNGKERDFTGAQQLPGNFPFSDQRLPAMADKFTPGDFASLLPKNLGNKAAAKVEAHAAGPALLRDLLRHPNQYDNIDIRNAYNSEAKKHGWKPITKSTVQVWRSKSAHDTIADSEGWAAWNLKYGKAIQRYRPDAMQIWESDDNHLDLHFRGDDDKNPYHRFKAIFVQDSSVDLVLGYALTDGTITPLQVQLAYISAMYYIRQLTGGEQWYAPHEVKTDRYALGALRPFYKSFAHYDESARGSKNRGWQENFFGCPDWKASQKRNAQGLPANNYSGNNVTATNAGFNPEYHRAMEKFYPSFERESDFEIAAFVQRLQQIDRHGTGSREALWLQKWAALPQSEKRPMSDEQFLFAFGLKHNPGTGKSNEITKMGIKVSLPGGKMTYAVPQAYYLPSVGKKVEIYYDPFNLCRVLVTDGDKLRFIAHTVELAAPGKRAAQLQPGSRRLLHTLLEEKRQNVEKVTSRKSADKATVSTYGIDAESALKLNGYLPKEITQGAADAYLSGNAYTDAQESHTYGGNHADTDVEDYDPAELM